MPKKNWKSHRAKLLGRSFDLKARNKDIVEQIVPHQQTPVYEIIGNIRHGLDPPDLVWHINWLAEVGNKRHIQVLDWILRKHPERESDPYPHYAEIRKAALDAKKKLEAKN